MDRKLIKILDFQFAIGAGISIISDGIKTIRNSSHDKIELRDIKTQEKLGVFKYSTGHIELTIVGLKRLIKSYSSIESNYIIFDGEDIQGNTLFRSGVLDYSLDLVPNNQVAILDKKKKNVLGSGELIVGSKFLKNSKSGRIVKINEKK